MKIVCPECRTVYDVTPSSLGSQGRQVRCVRCKAVWYAEMPQLAANVIPLASHDARTAPLMGVVRTVSGKSAASFPADPAATGAAETPQDAEFNAVGPEAPVADAEAVQQQFDVPPMSESGAEATAAADIPVASAAPEGAPAEEGAEASAPTLPPPMDIESIAARRSGGPRPKRPPSKKWRTHGLLAATIALAAIDAGLIVSRSHVVRVLPQTASLFAAIGMPVNLRELKFKDIKTTREQHDGAGILVVEGTIVTTGRAVTDVPRLRFSIGAANGHEIYAWTALPMRTRLAPGENLAFRTRLASPPEQGRFVNVRFFNRSDLATGLR